MCWRWIGKPHLWSCLSGGGEPNLVLLGGFQDGGGIGDVRAGGQLAGKWPGGGRGRGACMLDRSCAKWPVGFWVLSWVRALLLLIPAAQYVHQPHAGSLPLGCARSRPCVAHSKPRFVKPKRLRFERHRVALLPHHCRSQGSPFPPCPASADRTRGRESRRGAGAPRTAGDRTR